MALGANSYLHVHVAVAMVTHVIKFTRLSARLLVACEFKGQKSTGGGGSGNEAIHVQYESKKSPVPVPFCYGKTGDFFPSCFARSVPFRRLARFRAHVYKFYISRDRPIDRSSAKRQPSFQVA